MSSSSINDPLLSCNCYTAKKFVPLWSYISQHENKPTVRCIPVFEAASERTFIWHTTLRTASQAHTLKPRTLLHGRGDSVPCDQARELSWRGAIRASVFQAERQHADKQSLTSPQRNVVFSREKELFMEARSSRTSTDGGVSSRLESNGLAPWYVLHNRDVGFYLNTVIPHVGF